MHDHTDPEWRKDLQDMAPDKKRAYLRMMLLRRVHCPQCLVKTPRPDRQPCYNCVNLPDDLGWPSSTVN